MSPEAKPHIMCVPFPSPGHVGPMLKLAKLLHSKGFYITFLNTGLNHHRLLESSGPSSLDSVPSFKFKAVSDWEHSISAKGIHVLCEAVMTKFLEHFKNLILKLNEEASLGSGSPPVSIILADCMMSFALDAAEQLGKLPIVLFWTDSAAGFLGYYQFQNLLDRALYPSKGSWEPLMPTDYSNDRTDGSLNMVIDWVPSMRGIPLKYIPSFIRITDRDDIMFNLHRSSVQRAAQSSAPLIFNSFDAFEKEVFKDISAIVSGPTLSIGPLHLLRTDDTAENSTDNNTTTCSFWKEDSQCLNWLDKREQNSVVYVSFGSITTMTNDHLVEFALGLGNSKHHFLWIIRPNLVSGESAVIPPEFLAQTKDRGLLISWCNQEKVLNHPSIGAFLTHCGWNSTLESICGGVPMLCSPFFAEQQTNCWFSSEKWGIGLELEKFGRDEVEKLVREIMEGAKGLKLRGKTKEWKKLAVEAAVSEKGSSYINFDKLVTQVLLPQKYHN